MYNKKSHIHFVGIGGIGMSGIATILRQQGYIISGCDADVQQQSIQNLKQIGCTIHQGNNSPLCHDPSIDILVYSSAIKQDNPELQSAMARGIPVIPRALMLAELMRTKYSIAIAGAHGKTTTTSLISHLLMEAQMDPTVIIGGHLKSISNNARMGTGNFLVAEADESDRSFLHLHATFAIVTNIDLEHLETYTDLEDIKDTFKKFIGTIPFYGKAIVCIDDPHVRSILPFSHVKVLKYGIEQQADADLFATDIQLEGLQSTCTIWRKGHEEPLGNIRLNMPGTHNILNALAAINLGLELDIPFTTISQALSTFKGVERRFTHRGTFNKADVFDDYGHHPHEIEATLKVARANTKKRLVVIFQPHRYSRTHHLWYEFIKVFKANPPDQLIITDIYAASEQPIDGITSYALAQEMQEHVSYPIVYAPYEDILKKLKPMVNPQDLVLCIGAGKQIGLLAQQLPTLDNQ